MGTVRLLLAFSVIATHEPYFRSALLINGGAAVICFFIISGFTIAFIINERYKKLDNWPQAFFINRVLRIYPTYFAVLVLAVALQLAQGQRTFLTHLFSTNDFLNFAVVATNFTILGQDLLLVAHELRAMPSLAVPSKDFLNVLPVIQAWTIGLELVMFAIAVFAFSRPIGIICVFLIGFALRAFMQMHGFMGEPWGYKILPNILVFFGLGGLSYLVYTHINKWSRRNCIIVAGCLASALIALCYAYDGFWAFAAWGGEPRLVVLYAVFAAAVPFIFSATRLISVDRRLGELSYPIYLSHIAVFDLVERSTGSEFIANHLYVTKLAACLTVSLVLQFSISQPIDLRRSHGLSDQIRRRVQ